MFDATQTGLKALLGLRQLDAWFATILTTTGTGANEACLVALAPTGKGLIVDNGFFGARLVQQASACGIAHTRLALPPDRPVDPDAVERAIDADAELRWVYFVSHETRAGLVNRTTEIGPAASRRGLLVAADVVSSAYAYPLDLEASEIDLAVTSSAKGLMAVPGLGIVFTRLASLPRLARDRVARGYYLDLLTELEVQRRDRQPRFAQPVALHAALHAACAHLARIGIETHMKRIRAQMEELVDHLASLGVSPLLAPEHRSWVAVNFRLPEHVRYPAFARRMQEEGYYLLYGIPGDDSHFQLSTIGDLEPAHVLGLKAALTTVLRS